MSKFPRMFAESTLKRMYGKLGLPEEAVGLLHDYFHAFANFYYILPLKDAFKIIERQNKNLVTEEQFIAFSEIARHEEHVYWILGSESLYTREPESAPIDREIIVKHLLDIDIYDYYRLSELQAGKKLYIPEKAELLKYRDDSYIEETPQTRAVTSFIKSELKLSSSEIRVLLDDMIWNIKSVDDRFDNIIEILESRKLLFSSEEHFNKFARLYSDLNNSTHIPANRGFAPSEVYKSEIPKSISLPPDLREQLRSGELNAIDIVDAFADIDYPDELKRLLLKEILSSVNAPSAAEKNVGRNDLCPCGSGKKYKKCCGKAR